jgi:hypothetical protein
MAFEFYSTAKCGARLGIEKLIDRVKRLLVLNIAQVKVYGPDSSRKLRKMVGRWKQ